MMCHSDCICRGYFDVADKYFTTEGDDVGLYFRSTDAVPVDFSDPQIQVCVGPFHGFVVML